MLLTSKPPSRCYRCRRVRSVPLEVSLRALLLLPYCGFRLLLVLFCSSLTLVFIHLFTKSLGTACCLRDVAWHPHQHVLALAGYGEDAPVLLYCGEARAEKQNEARLIFLILLPPPIGRLLVTILELKWNALLKTSRLSFTT